MSGAGSLFVALVVVALVACALPSAHCDSVNFDVAAAITKWLPPLNTFSSVGDISSLNSAYQFGKYRQRLRCLYTSLAPETANYHVFELVENDVLVKITLYRSVNPDETRFYPGIVLMGPDRLNIDKGTQNPPNYFPSIVDVPVGYDTYVRWENSKEDFLPIYQGIIPFTWYQMLTFNVSTLEPGLYVIAVFNSIVDGSTPGAYALALGYSINITFDDFMLGPFHAYFTYEWQGFGGGLILLPYFIIIGIGVLIIAHQTFWRGNSPRTWYSMFVFWGGLLIIGSGCVVAEFLAFAFLQQPSPIPESINPSVIWTALMLALPLIVGILICFFGLMIKVNLLVRVIVLFLAVGSCLVWASYYVGPAIAILGALLPAKRLPLHRLPFCGDYFRRFDEDLSGRRRNYVDHDGDWDEDYDDEDDKKQSKSDKKKGGKKDNKGKKTAAPAASSTTAAAASSAAAAASSSAASSASGEKPFPVEEVGIQFVGGDDDDTESDPNEDEAVARAASVNSVVAAQNGQIDREDASSDFDA